MRVGFLCMESVFSVRPLEALLDAGHDVRFVMRPVGGVDTRKKPLLKRHGGFDVAVKRALGFVRGGGGVSDDDHKRNPFAVAARRAIPAYLVGDASCPAAVQLLRKERVDVVVIAFFNQLLRAPFLEVPALGALNLHPSLLPLHRGPAPLFWTFKDGLFEAGLTLHKVAAGEDDGDVVLQEPVPAPLGTAGEDLVDELADRAALMVVDAVGALAAGTSSARPQDRERATRAPRPKDEDLLVDPALGAQRAFHFVRGVGRWNPLYVRTGSTRVRVVDALEVDETRRLPGETALTGDILHLGCHDGVVVLRARIQP